MNDWSDQQLLRAYAERRSDAAFGELVRRHVDGVYSAAWRMTGEEQSARDAAQAVFVALAQQAGSLAGHPVLSGWLHCTARNVAAKSVRSEVRRRAREQEAAAMNQLLSTEAEPAWEQVAPHLDTALGELNEAERDALMLRYFEKKSAPEMSGVLGISEDAAQKRVTRAVERLRELFAQRGVTIGAGGLMIALSAHAVEAAPTGLAAQLTAGALAGTTLGAAAAATTTTTTATTTTAMTLFQKTAIAAALATTVGAGIYQAREAANARAEARMLQQRQAPLAAQVQQLQKERDAATNRLAGMAAELAKNQGNSLELLKLRGQAGLTRQASGEAEQLRKQLAQQTGAGGSNFMAGAMADAMKQALEQQVEGRLARMTASLNLTPEQTKAAHDILMQQSKVMSAGMQQAFSGKFDKAQITQLAKEGGNPDAQIKALLTPEQLAAYPAYQQQENAHTASLAANSELLQMQATLDLTAEQQDQAYTALYNLSLNQLTGATKPTSTNMVEVMQGLLDQKATALASVLTPTQLEQYRQQLAIQANLQKNILIKMNVPGAAK